MSVTTLTGYGLRASLRLLRDTQEELRDGFKFRGGHPALDFAATLAAIGEISRSTGKPVLSSTLCLAWVLGKRLGLGGNPPWEDRKWESQLHSL